MEDELDVLSSQPSDLALASWHNICKKCFDDITERSKPLARQTKQTFALADTADHVLVFNTYGASIKSSNSGSKETRGDDTANKYLKIRSDVELDLEKAKRGEYTMSELVWREDNGCLGEYGGNPVYLKKGKFGLYAEYGKTGDKQTISLKPLYPNKCHDLSTSANNISLEDVVDLIRKKNSVMSQEDASKMFLPSGSIVMDGEYKNDLIDMSGYGMVAKSNVVGSSSSNVSSGDENRTSDKTLLRNLRSDLSIRKGKYGPYIFHKTSQMTKPAFHPIKPFKDRWESMDNLELITAIENTYRLSI